MQRREFLRNLAAAATAMGLATTGRRASAQEPERDKWGELLPRRPLGRTGELVTMLGIGGFHIGWTSEKDAQEVIETAIAEGVRFFDNAESYSAGLSEERYGKFLVPKYRDQAFIMTKTNSSTAAQAREHLEGSLRRLKCDVIDLWQLHTLQSPEDVDQRIANEVLDVMREAVESGKVRHIGFTGHRQPAAHARMLERTQGEEIFETAQMPINIVDAGAEESFTTDVLPTLAERNYGVIAMKTLADGRFFATREKNGKVFEQAGNPIVPEAATIPEALGFVWSLPVSTLVTGAENAALLKEKAEICREFASMTEEKRMALLEKAAELAEAYNFEYYKQA